MAVNLAPQSVSAGAFPAGIDADAVARLKQQPGFIEAVRASATATVEIYRGARLLNAIVNDRGRFIISSFALYLHFLSRRDPSVKLTAGRLRTLAVQQGVCSAGRAAAVIALMRWGGYLANAPAPVGERSERLVVTSRLMELQLERWRMQMTVMTRLFPEAAIALDRLDDPQFISAYALHQAGEYLSGFRLLDHAPELAVFLEGNGGLMILLSLVAAGAGDRRAAPETASISISALARRFGVSRPHVIATLRSAEAEGLLQRRDDEVRIDERLTRAIEHFYALVYLFNLECIRAALAESEPRAADLSKI